MTENSVLILAYVAGVPALLIAFKIFDRQHSRVAWRRAHNETVLEFTGWRGRGDGPKGPPPNQGSGGVNRDGHLKGSTMAEQTTKIGRLALREEGTNWNAYYAMPGTMDGAIPLGSIRLATVLGRPERKEAFMTLMREIVADIIEQSVGVRPTWGGPENAPEHEHAGRA
jgi:hypothetical protein